MSKKSSKDTSRASEMVNIISAPAEINQRYYQHIEFNNIDIPSLDEWESGREYNLEIKVKLIKKTEKANDNVVGEFEILLVKDDEENKEEYTPEQIRIKKILG